MLSALAASSANESCSPACRPLVPACAPWCSVTILAHPVFESLTLQSPPFPPRVISNSGDLECPAMNEIPALGRDSLNPFKTSLPPVAKREQRGPCIIGDRRLSCRSTGEGWEERQIKPAGTRLLCSAMLPASICGSLIPDKKAAQHLSCAATE